MAGAEMNDTITNDLKLGDYERYTLVAWSLTVVVLSYTGNLVVLASSYKYNAIKLDKISVILIRNLSFADLSSSVYIILTTGNIIMQEYQYGEFLCYWSYCFALTFTAAEMGLICALNVSKLITLHYPLRAVQRKSRTGRWIAALVWILAVGWSLTVRATNYFTKDVTTYFNIDTFQCFPIIHTTTAGVMIIVGGIFYNVLPMLTLIVSTIWLYTFVRKISKSQKCTVQTLTLISGVFLFSYGPYTVGVVLFSKFQNSPEFLYFFRFAAFNPYLNYAANPIIYFATLKSFREFVLNKISLFNNIRTVKVTPIIVKDKRTRGGYADTIANMPHMSRFQFDRHLTSHAHVHSSLRQTVKKISVPGTAD